MKKIMVVAGGTFQVPLCKRIKEMGYKLVVVNPYKDSPAFFYADEVIQEDVLNKEIILAAAKRLNIDAVLTDQTDISVETTAFLANQLDLPGLPLDKVELFTNKYAMREFSSRHDFPIPAYKRCFEIQDALDFFRELQGRMIIKPCNAQSSRGIYIIETEAELQAHFVDALNAAHGNNPHVVAERYIEGPEFTVDGIIVDGKHHTLAISRKTHFGYSATIAEELFFTETDPHCDYNRLIEQHNHLMNLTEVPFALTHTEYKYENGEFILIEMAARGGGTLISSHIVPLMSGVDNYGLLIEQALGLPFRSDGLIVDTPEERSVVLKFFDVDQFGGSAGSVVSAIKGLDVVTNIEGLVTINLEFEVGAHLIHAADDRSRIGYYIAYADTPSDLRQRMKRIEESISVEFD